MFNRKREVLGQSVRSQTVTPQPPEFTDQGELNVDHLPELTKEEREAMESLGPEYVRSLLEATDNDDSVSSDPVNVPTGDETTGEDTLDDIADPNTPVTTTGDENTQAAVDAGTGLTNNAEPV